MKKTILSFLLLFTFLLSGCQDVSGAPLPSSSRILASMDTVMNLTAYGENAEQALDAASQRIQQLDALLNAESADSEVFAINRSGNQILSEDTRALLVHSLRFHQLTGGYFDITVYPLSKLWGFPSKEYRVPADAEITKVLEQVGSEQIAFDPAAGRIQLYNGQQIDFGGIAKGYTSQKVIELFQEMGISSAIVSLGGNVQCLGKKPDGSLWKVGIKDPAIGSSELAAVVSVENQAVITSGGYERYFTDPDTGRIYQHILNPKTGYPVDNDLSSVTIVAEDGVLADALSTALFSMGFSEAVSFWKAHSSEFEVILMDNSRHIYITEGLEGFVTSENDFTVLKR